MTLACVVLVRDFLFVFNHEFHQPVHFYALSRLLPNLELFLLGVGVVLILARVYQ